MIDKLFLQKLLFNTLLAAAVLCPVTSAAHVIYNWVPVDHTEQLVTVFGKIKVADQAWLSGGFAYSPPLSTYPDNIDPGSPLISFDFHVAPVKDYGTPQSVCNGTGACTIHGAPITGEGGPVGFFGDFVFTFDIAGLLCGNLSANDGESHVLMASNPDGLWTVSGFGSDDDALGCYWEYCTGGTGYWKLDPTSIPLRAPAELPLLAGAMLALFGARRIRPRR